MGDSFRGVLECAFKSNIKLIRDNLGWLNKFTIPGTCGFPLANLHSVESLDFVPLSILLNQLILFCICSGSPQSIRHFRNEIEKFPERFEFFMMFIAGFRGGIKIKGSAG